MRKRIIGYDIARALAIFGMVIVNFKIAMGADQNGPDWLVALAGQLNGRAAATFVVLAGAGISMFSQKGRETGERARQRRDRNTLLKRALFLFVVGLLYTPIWPADILHFYGVYIAVAAFLVFVSSRQLWIFSLCTVFAFVVLLTAFDYEMGWNWDTLEYAGFWTAEGLIRHLFFNGFHPVIPWIAFLLVGMILGRQNMADPNIRRRILFWGLAAVVVAEGTSWVFSNALADIDSLDFLFGTSPMPPMPLYMMAGTGVACVVIAASIELGERFESASWLAPFVSTGQLALTLYVAHVVIGMGILEEMGRLGDQTLMFSLLASFIFCLIGVVFAHFWRRRFNRGPLELVMRKLTDPRKK